MANVTYILTHLIYLEKHIFVILTRGRGEWSAVVIGTQLVSVFGLFFLGGEGSDFRYLFLFISNDLSQSLTDGKAPA